MSNREAPLAVPVRHRGKGTLRAAQAARDAVARGILDIAEHPFLIERLDGKRPILGEIRIHMHVENDICSDHVRRLTLVASQTELLRILDFDNRMGFKHFGISTSEMLPDAQVMPLLQKVRRALGAAGRALQEREAANVAASIDMLLTRPINTPAPAPGAGAQAPGPDGPAPENALQITDDRDNQFIL